jgi:hypothetical protein
MRKLLKAGALQEAWLFRQTTSKFAIYFAAQMSQEQMVGLYALFAAYL